MVIAAARGCIMQGQPPLCCCLGTLLWRAEQSGGSACALPDTSLNMDTATPAPKHGHSSFCLSLSWSGTV